MPKGTTDPVLAGRYRVLERLGRGGMATVFLAEDQRLGRRVAVKRLHADSPEDTARRFEREAKLLASLNHPNIVSVFDTVADDEGVLIVMEYVEGRTLKQAMADGPIRGAEAGAIVGGIAAALDHAHDHGVVHRDVKPANVLCGPAGVVKLADLGIATAAERTQITRTGTVLGTPSYMAPEQLSGGALSSAVDVYALAAVAFEMLSGRKAQDGRTPMEIAHRVATEPAPDLREAWPDAPPAAAAVLCRAMAREPAERPASAGELAAELDAALAEDRTESTLALGGGAGGAGAAAAGAAAAGAAAGARSPHPPGRSASPRRARRSPGPARSRRGRGTRPGLAPWIPVAALLLVVGAVIALASSGDDDGSEPRAGIGAEARQQERPQGGGRDEQAPAGDPPEEDPPSDGTATPSFEEGVALNAEGKALIDRGEPAAAVAPLERAVAALEGSGDLNYAYALFNLGQALRLSGRPAEAIPILERRLQIPNQTETVQRELDLARAEADGAGSGEGDDGRGKEEKGGDKKDRGGGKD